MSIDILFDGPPGPESGRFVEVENTETRESISYGEWIERDDGYWVLRIDPTEPTGKPHPQITQTFENTKQE